MPFSLVTRGRVKLYCVLLDYGIFGEKTDRAVNVESIMQSTNSDTSIGSTATGEIPSCNDGRAPDVTTGLCADCSQPQGQVPDNVSGTAGGVAATGEQLVCNDGTAPDVTTGLCADCSQPQSVAVGQIELSANGTGFSSGSTTQDTQEVYICT